MATILTQLDVHYSPALSPFCPLKLLLLFVACNPTSMPWGSVYEAGACIPSFCLKCAVIAIANALLAAGWLLVVCLAILPVFVTSYRTLQSVLSIASELILPKVSQMPPTFPRFLSPPSHELPSLPSTKRVTGVRSQSSVHTRATSSQQRRTTSPNDNNVSHHVQFTVADDSNGIVVPPVSSSSGHSTEGGEAALSRVRSESKNSEERSPVREVSPPALQVQQRDSGDAVIRGRKLSFLRKHISTSRSSPKRRVGSHGELPASRGASPARPDQSSPSKLRKSSSLFQMVNSCLDPVKADLQETRSNESLARAVPRTDPYQAPYFFPSPLSPDAEGYTSRVRAERVHSPDVRSPRRTISDSSELETSTSAIPESQLASSSRLPSPPAQLEKARPTRLSRRSWHISFRHNIPKETERPTSWTSEAATLVNGHQTPSDSSSRPPSLKQKPRKSLNRRYVFRLPPSRSAA